MANEHAEPAPVMGALLPIPEERALFKLSESPALFTALLKHPEIQPQLFPVGAELPDLEAGWEQVIPLECDGGGWLVIDRGAGSFEFSPMFLADAGEVTAKSHNLLHWVFSWLGAQEVLLRLPADAARELQVAKDLGFSPRFVYPNSWARMDRRVDTYFMGLTLHDWIVGNAKLYVTGEAVREATEANPENFPMLDAYVGAAVACAQAGSIDRGAEVLNRFRGLFSLAPFEVVNGWLRLDGVKIQVRGAQLVIKADNQ